MLYAYWIAYMLYSFHPVEPLFGTHNQHGCYKHGAFSLQIKMLMKCTFLCQLKIQDTVISL